MRDALDVKHFYSKLRLKALLRSGVKSVVTQCGGNLAAVR